MTTNVYDFPEGILASESRWSCSTAEYIFYVDNTGYEKIVSSAKMAVLFAGLMQPIDIWKIWLAGGGYGYMPELSDYLAICVVNLEDGAIKFDHRVKEISDCRSARFAGSGSEYALRCWDINKNAIKSIETACEHDNFSGGKINYLNRITNDTNVRNYSSANEVVNSFLTKGEKIMNNNTQKQVPILISEAIKDEAVSEAFKQAIKGGTASICAPFKGMGTPWTQDEKNNLYAVMREYFPHAK